MTLHFMCLHTPGVCQLDTSGFSELNRFANEGELITKIYRAIYYFNHERIHGKLKMPPVEFRQKFEKQDIKTGGLFELCRLVLKEWQ
jgi:transposase InsO family protein